MGLDMKTNVIKMPIAYKKRKRDFKVEKMEQVLPGGAVQKWVHVYYPNGQLVGKFRTMFTAKKVAKLLEVDQ